MAPNSEHPSPPPWYWVLLPYPLSDGLFPLPAPGVRMGSLGLFLQCAISLLFSLVMDRLVQRFGTRAVYLASVVAFPVAAGATCLSRSVVVVTASAALTGFTFSALQILPYTLASLYHREKQVLALAAEWSGVEGQLTSPGPVSGKRSWKRNSLIREEACCSPRARDLGCGRRV